jgi:FtsP/CotA-like multicopper oxidase with cupredoxin domain
MTTNDVFPTTTAGLPQARPTRTLRLKDGDHLALPIAPVRLDLEAGQLRMFAYDGSIPGPTLHVDQGSEITVHVTNQSDVETTVHWHGLRLENRYDGVPYDTQEPIGVGGEFTYRVQFPDPGFYWYHPHIREDVGQEMGLYGTIVVEPAEEAYWPAVDRQLTITLDDLLVEDGRLAPFLRSGPTFTAMGRFGNVLLVNGETDLVHTVSAGDVVRLQLVNTANTRLFDVVLPGARMKLVGGDSGRYERETFVQEILLAPSERAVVDVLFDSPGRLELGHRTPERLSTLATFEVLDSGTTSTPARDEFDTLRTDPELAAVRRGLENDVARAPDKVLAFWSRMPLLYGTDDPTATSYACPMHPEVTASGPQTCPKCGMKLVPVAAGAGQPNIETHSIHESGDGLEWEDLMPEINRASDRSNMIWELIDRATGAVNHDISWSFRVGDRVKIRLVNDMDSDHPMHHPFHIHGAGRFLVLAREGVLEPNLVWKDTVLVPAGHTVDILLDVTNPGLWMAHCHIAEHTESGMMFSFRVTPC